MERGFGFLPAPVVRQQAVFEILECSRKTLEYGLVLSPAEAKELAEARAEALAGHGRVEFGGGIIKKLILAFCDSPYILPGEYFGILHELIDVFYYFKSELPDTFADDELIRLMKEEFDGGCGGSLELLKGGRLEALARRIRFGGEAEEWENEEEFEE